MGLEYTIFVIVIMFCSTTIILVSPTAEGEKEAYSAGEARSVFILSLYFDDFLFIIIALWWMVFCSKLGINGETRIEGHHGWSGADLCL